MATSPRRRANRNKKQMTSVAHGNQPFRLLMQFSSEDHKWMLGSDEFVRMPIGTDKALWYHYRDYEFSRANDLEAMALELMYQEIMEETK